MLRIICVAASLALANCDPKDLNVFEGQWTAVKVYPDLPVKGDCAQLTIELATDQCKLGKKKIPVFKMTSPTGEIIKVPVVPMDPEENDVEEAFAPKCVCKNKKIDTDAILAFRYLSDNYFLLYTSFAGPEMAILIAKDVPTEEELEEYERKSTVLSDEEGSIMCTKDKETGNKKMSNKLAAKKDTTHWMNYRPTKTTTEPATN